MFYIRDNLARGVSQETLKHTLLLHGWRARDIDDAFSDIGVFAPQEVVTSAGLTVKPNVLLVMWIWPLVWALVVFALVLIYQFIYFSSLLPLGISSAFAGSAAFCIGFSFALAPISYYFDFLDKMLVSRRGFGVVGYFFALAYSISLLFVNEDRYLYGFLENLASMDFVLGLLAMMIFTIMALISNNWSIRKLGPVRWKIILRFGYLAYALLIIRAIVLEKDSWVLWFQSPNGLPPIRIFVSLFATLVIVCRILMIFSLHFKKEKLKQ